jgi:hypothetical protein
VLSRCKSLPSSTDPEDRGADRDEWSERVEQAVRLAFAEVVSTGRASSLLAVFRAADTNGSGTLSPVEFHSALSRAGLGLRASEVRRIVRKFDKDGDGRVNWAEFMDFVNVSPKAGGRVPAGGAEVGAATASPGGAAAGGAGAGAGAGGASAGATGTGAGAGGGASFTVVASHSPAVPSDAVASSKLCRELLMLRLVHLPRLTAALGGEGSAAVALSPQGSSEAVSYLRSRFTVVDRVRSGVVSIDDVAGVWLTLALSLLVHLGSVNPALVTPCRCLGHYVVTRTRLLFLLCRVMSGWFHVGASCSCVFGPEGETERGGLGGLEASVWHRCA